MSEYIVTARKWRPMRFEEVVGQRHVTTTLRNALAAGRIAHAYLFAGQRGCGKTTTARILAKAVNCRSPKDNNPDNECDICVEITEGRSFDVLEIDGASNRGVEEIRDLRKAVQYTPAKGKYKVYIIDEVHMLTKDAFNALLKTLEEPPSHILFIFATTEIHKVPPTILSRCQRFYFRRISIGEIMENLRGIAREEGIKLDDDALLLVAKKGDGSLRDAQSLFDQVVSLCGRTVTHQQILHALNILDQELYFRVTDLVKARDARGGLTVVEELTAGGYDLREFLAGLAEHLRNILVAKTTGSADLVEVSDVYKKRYLEEAGKFSVTDLLRMQRLVNSTEASLRWSAQPRFRLETDLIQLITLASASEVGDLIHKIEDLKKKLSDGSTATPIPIVSSVPASTVAEAAASRTGPAGENRRSFSARPADVRSAAGSVTPPPAVAPVVPEAVLRPPELQARWPDFVEEVRRQKIALGAVLGTAMPLSAANGVVKIGCQNEFQVESVKRNRSLLTEALVKVFGTRLRVEAEVHRADEPAPGSAPADQGSPAPGEEHPIVKILKRELGAEPL